MRNCIIRTQTFWRNQRIQKQMKMMFVKSCERHFIFPFFFSNLVFLRAQIEKFFFFFIILFSSYHENLINFSRKKKILKQWTNTSEKMRENRKSFSSIATFSMCLEEILFSFALKIVTEMKNKMFDCVFTSGRSFMGNLFCCQVERYFCAVIAMESEFILPLESRCWFDMMWGKWWSGKRWKQSLSHHFTYHSPSFNFFHFKRLIDSDQRQSSLHHDFQ